MLSISIIVPVRNGGEAFVQCLTSVRHSASDEDEIIVIADGESDGVWRRAYAFGARVLRNEISMGPAAARNAGAREAAGDILLFVDADVCLRPETVERVRAVFGNDPDVAAVFGSYDDEPAGRSFLTQYRNLLHHYTHQCSSEKAKTFWCGCGAIRSEIFKGAGGFDDTFTTACIEDIELGYRLTKAGHSIRLQKDIQVKHLKQWNAAEMLRTDVFSRAVPWTVLILSHGEMEDDLNLRIEDRISVLLVFCLIGAVLSGFLFPGMLLIAGVLAAVFTALNLPFYRFLARKRGLAFAITAVPWHGVFYLCGGLGFLVGATRFLRARGGGRLRSRASEAEPAVVPLEADSNADLGKANL